MVNLIQVKYSRKRGKCQEMTEKREEGNREKGTGRNEKGKRRCRSTTSLLLEHENKRDTREGKMKPDAILQIAGIMLFDHGWLIAEK